MKPISQKRMLNDDESKLERALAGGHIPSIAKAVVQQYFCCCAVEGEEQGDVQHSVTDIFSLVLHTCSEAAVQ